MSSCNITLRCEVLFAFSCPLVHLNGLHSLSWKRLQYSDQASCVLPFLPTVGQAARHNLPATRDQRVLHSIRSNSNLLLHYGGCVHTREVAGLRCRRKFAPDGQGKGYPARRTMTDMTDMNQQHRDHRRAEMYAKCGHGHRIADAVRDLPTRKAKSMRQRRVRYSPPLGHTTKTRPWIPRATTTM